MVNIAVFASGKGTNAEKIIAPLYPPTRGNANAHAQERVHYRVTLMVITNAQAGAVDVAKKNSIPFIIPEKKSFYEKDDFLSDLKKHNIDFIVLAGFLWMIPSYLIKAFPKKIINLHPALLPKFGGKGMYGMNVHKAVLAAKETESGITIHFVNANYDEGEIIFQAKCEVSAQDTPETLAKKVQELEHRYFGEVIEKIVLL